VCVNWLWFALLLPYICMNIHTYISVCCISRRNRQLHVLHRPCPSADSDCLTPTTPQTPCPTVPLSHCLCLCPATRIDLAMDPPKQQLQYSIHSRSKLAALRFIFAAFFFWFVRLFVRFASSVDSSAWLAIRWSTWMLTSLRCHLPSPSLHTALSLLSLSPNVTTNLIAVVRVCVSLCLSHLFIYFLLLF